jgi:hypothetical protein
MSSETIEKDEKKKSAALAAAEAEDREEEEDDDDDDDDDDEEQQEYEQNPSICCLSVARDSSEPEWKDLPFASSSSTLHAPPFRPSPLHPLSLLVRPPTPLPPHVDSALLHF